MALFRQSLSIRFVANIPPALPQITDEQTKSQTVTAAIFRTRLLSARHCSSLQFATGHRSSSSKLWVMYCRLGFNLQRRPPRELSNNNSDTHARTRSCACHVNEEHHWPLSKNHLSRNRRAHITDIYDNICRSKSPHPWFYGLKRPQSATCHRSIHPIWLLGEKHLDVHPTTIEDRIDR